MSSSLSASQLHTVNMRDPLNRVLGENSYHSPISLHLAQSNEPTCIYCVCSPLKLPQRLREIPRQFIPPVLLSSANLFLLISSILGSKMAGPHTQFVQSFMEECVECLEQSSRGSILQFMPFTMVSNEPGGELETGGDKEVDVASDMTRKRFGISS